MNAVEAKKMLRQMGERHLWERETREIIKLIIELQTEMEGLKCCGNCEHYLTVVNEGRCFEGIKDIYRYDPKAIPTDGNCVCEKWQKAGE